ncbi:Tetratricopeptide repeat-containing protein [Mariprofundus aestuarium]|uniref:Tetratricopeptide repeat-containing protein n=1 Tax=Mariprofundus aestuarium TaxID=1921086 RepID=A0A2K8KZ82_MARES|nr:hypothetical protein [Mariprofundus aestuarium]ATX80308.1 Tetratricopeptide repeat-containing protein [Mariprofundus aestuarium]
MLQHTNKQTVGFIALILPVATLALTPLSAYAETPFEASQQLIETGQITEARRTLELELRLRPENIEARYNLAVLLEESDHQPEAIALYQKNLEKAVRHLPSLINLASALERSGRISEAQQWLEKGTKEIKHEATPWYLLAMMSERRGDNITANTLYQKALKADPLNGFAYLHYAIFQSGNDVGDRGIKYGAKAIRLLPKCAPCWSSYGTILQHVGKDGEALDAYQRSLSIDTDINTRKKLIGLLRRMGEVERAERMQLGINAWQRNHKE